MPYKKISALDPLTAITDDDLLVVVNSPASGPGTRKITWAEIVAYFATGVNTLTLSNQGLHLLDTDASHDLIVKPGSDLTADRILTLTTGDANRLVALQGNLTVEAGSVVNQDLTSDAKPTFAGVTLTEASSLVSSATAPTMIVNAGDSDMYIGLKSGSTADQRAYLAFYAYNEALAANPDWLLGRNATNDFIVFDKDNATHRLCLNDGGNTYISACGSGAVIVNGYAGEAGQATSGLHIYSGGASSTLKMVLSPANGIYSGSTSSLVRMFGGTSNDGSGVLVCGSANATYPNKGILRVGSTDVVLWGATGLMVGGDSFPSSGTGTIAVKTGTAPVTSPADAFQMYSADYAAGNACPHFLTENGTVVRLVQDLGYDSYVQFATLTLQRDSASASVTNVVYSTANYSPTWRSRRSRGTAASPTAVQSGDTIGYFEFDGRKVTAWAGPVASIAVTAAGNFTDASAPTRITFSVTASGSTTLTEAMRIDPSGNIGIGQTTFGSSATKTLAVGSGTAPGSSPADAFQMYSADFAAGNACPHFLTEDGTVIVLNQDLKTTASPVFASLGVNVSGITHKLSVANGAAPGASVSSVGAACFSGSGANNRVFWADGNSTLSMSVNNTTKIATMETYEYPSTADSILFAIQANGGNVGFCGALAVGTSAKNNLQIKNGTAPSGSYPADSTAVYAKDISDATSPDNGKSALHLTTEAGSVVKLYQQAAVADTSGAALAALEAEVNKLKAILRKAGLMAT